MKTCSIEGCKNKHKAKGLCRKHYESWRYASDPIHRAKRILEATARIAKKYQNNPEFHAKENIRINTKKAFKYQNDPEFRAKQNTSSIVSRAKRYHTDPVYHAKQNALIVAKISKRLKDDPLFKFKKNIRNLNLIRMSFKRHGFLKSSKSIEILGCELTTAMKFVGWFEGCEIHHITFLCTAKTEADIIRLNHYTNLKAVTPKEHKELHKLHGKDVD